VPKSIPKTLAIIEIPFSFEFANERTRRGDTLG
jgi:hypothetical protein